jgi:hypothetical protein
LKLTLIKFFLSLPPHPGKITPVPLTIENLDDSLEKELGNITIGDYELEDED